MRADVEAKLAVYVQQLADLVAVAGVSADGVDSPVLRESAEHCARLLTEAGFPIVKVLQVKGSAPAVWAERPGPPGAPVVLLYAHHDVQPAGDLDAWTSSPWQAEVRDGRLFGRGTADDKGGLLLHLAALEHAGDLPLTIRVLVEGDEEIGSPAIHDLLATYADELRADVVVLPDAVNADIDAPSLTVGLRGLVDLVVTVTTAQAPLHSGLYGGAVPDAIGVLLRLLGTLTSADGTVLVEGLLHQEPEADVPVPDGPWDPGAVPGLLVEQDPKERQRKLAWAPSATVLGLDVPSVAGSAAILVPQARARVLVRLAPADDATTAAEALVRHLTSQSVQGAEIAVEVRAAAPGLFVPAGSAAGTAALSALEDGYGTPAVPVAVGGSIPFTSAYGKAFGAVPMLVTAVQDPLTRAHSTDESMDLSGFVSAIVAEASLLQRLGSGG